MNEQRNEQHQSQDNHFFDVEIFGTEEVTGISGAAACSYLGVYEYRLMMSNATRNDSC